MLCLKEFWILVLGEVCLSLIFTDPLFLDPLIGFLPIYHAYT